MDTSIIQTDTGARKRPRFVSDTQGPEYGFIQTQSDVEHLNKRFDEDFNYYFLLDDSFVFGSYKPNFNALVYSVGEI